MVSVDEIDDPTKRYGFIVIYGDPTWVWNLCKVCELVPSVFGIL